MLGASISLLVEGGGGSMTGTAIGAMLGVAFVYVVSALLKRIEQPGRQSTFRRECAWALLIIAVMTAHSAAEGLQVGAAFGDTGIFGIAIAIAIAIHNIPEGLAISLVLVPKGASVRSAAGWSIFSSLPQPLLAVPSYLFVEQFQALLPGARLRGRRDALDAGGRAVAGSDPAGTQTRSRRCGRDRLRGDVHLPIPARQLTLRAPTCPSVR